MPDRSRGAAAAITYDHACHLLSVSPRYECRNLVSESHSLASNFSTRRLTFNDHHAVALSAALLVSHGASWPLIRRYLRTYVHLVSPNAVSSFDSLAVSPFGSRPRPTAIPLPCLLPTSNAVHTINFSLNPCLTSRGAAAIVAACLLIPRRISIELHITLCTAVTDIALTPWLTLLQVERNRQVGEKACATLQGLCLDACPISTIDPVVAAALPDLSWISLRSTHISNLWRTVELLNEFHRLAAVLLKGHIGETHCFQATRHCVDTVSAQSSHPHSDNIRNGNPAGPTDSRHHPTSSHASSNLEERTHTNSLIRKNDQPVTASDQIGIPSVQPNLVHTTPNSLSLPFDSSSDMTRARAAPVTKSPHYRSFILAATKPYLRMLDGVEITPSERERACQFVRRNFEDPPIQSGLSTRTKLLHVLRHREVGMSLRPSPSKQKQLREQNRPRKRRRTQDNLMAAIAAAGLPVPNGETLLSRARGITVALAATSSAILGNDDDHVSNNLRLVREAALSIQGASERERLSMLPSWSDSRITARIASSSLRKKYPQAGMHSYCDDEIASSLSTALVSRRGKPRVQYLCQGNDRPRQFEYNPAKPSQLVYGTEYGYLVVMDEASGVVKGSCRSGGGPGTREAGDVIRRTAAFDQWVGGDQGVMPRFVESSPAPVYGLSWLNRSNGLFISGTSGGSIHVYDVGRMSDKEDGGCRYSCDTFNGLTSISVSMDDSRFAVSGITEDVGLFDLETGRCVETMKSCHAESINVIKFAHQNPHVLVTSSFDRCVKKWDLRESRPGGARRPIFTTKSATDNVMVCLSPDDSRLLVSAVDNEVRQYSASDGSLEIEFYIPKTGSDYNFTRSYYMNNRDYIITGSSMESVVRVYSARTGSFFTEVDMDDRSSGKKRPYNVLSLRANPARKFNFSTLLFSPDESVNEVMATVDMYSR